MSRSVLLISEMAGAEDCANSLAGQLGLGVEVAPTRKAAFAALRRREYSVVVVDDCIVEADPVGADLLWKHSGFAVPLQVNFAISNTSRLVREVRAALTRRNQEHALALRAAACALGGELKATVAGLLLQSQLALAEPDLTPKLADKLKTVVELAGALRQQLERPQA